jgi:hypothetical protein
VKTGGLLLRWLTRGLVLATGVAVVAAVLAAALLGQVEAGGCTAGESGERDGGSAAPLLLRPGRWYEVGATEFGGPRDAGAGSFGAIPDATQSYLPAHPDSFAELSLLPSNPAAGGHFTFRDANALGNLPYLTGLRVEHAGRQEVLYKRDIGYGQGPGDRIGNGQPYRLDVWWQSAQTLQVTKTAVRIELAGASGAAATLGQLPESQESPAQQACEGEASTGGLPLAPGVDTRVLEDGLAAAGEQAPAAVRAMVAAGNRLHAAGYEYGAGHAASLDVLQPAYDCSSAVSYMLHAAGLVGASALDSTALESFGEPGPGRYVTVYANAGHAFIYVAGVRLDTVEDPAYDSGPNSARPGPRWRVYRGVPAWAGWVDRHPAGL